MGKLRNLLFPNKDNNVVETNKTNNTQTTDNDSKVKNAQGPAILTPKVFIEVEDIAKEIFNGKAVIVDLTETDKNEARRICDFLNGVCYALNGEVKKIATLVYMFSPFVQ